MARMPTPPQPVMPPEGIAPVTQEVGLGAGDDAMSPTTMVLNYLKSRGYQPTSENVRRALEANSRDPGVITGLRSDTGATEAEDQAAMRAAGVGRGGGAKPASTSSGVGSTGPVDRHDDADSSAPPSNDYGTGPNWGAAGLGGAAGLLGAGGGALLAKAILDRARMGQGQYVGNAQMPTGKVTDVDLPDPRALPSPGSMEKQMFDALRGPASNAALPEPPAQLPPPARPPEAPVAPSGSVIQQPPPDVRPNLVPPEPPATVTPANRGGSTQDLLDQANIATGRTPASRPPYSGDGPRSAPTAPLRPRMGRLTPEILADLLRARR